MKWYHSLVLVENFNIAKNCKHIKNISHGFPTTIPIIHRFLGAYFNPHLAIVIRQVFVSFSLWPFTLSSVKWKIDVFDMHQIFLPILKMITLAFEYAGNCWLWIKPSFWFKTVATFRNLSAFYHHSFFLRWKWLRYYIFWRKL